MLIRIKLLICLTLRKCWKYMVTKYSYVENVETENVEKIGEF